MGKRCLKARLPPQTEESFLRQVIQLARLKGWRTAHFRPGLTKSGNWVTAVQGDGKGFFDLVLIRDRIVFVETKAEAGRISAEQQKWIDAAAAAGGEVYVWRPSDWDEILEVLE